MIVQVSTATYLQPIVLRDFDGNAVTDKGNADFDAVATLQDDDAPDDPTTIALTVTHTGNGIYSQKGTFPETGVWSVLTSVDVDGETIEDIQTVQVVTAAQADPAGALSGVNVAYNGPVTQSGDVEIFRADDYAETDNRELPWTLTNVASLPDLTGATVTLYAKHRTAPLNRFTAVGAIDTPTGSTRAFHAEVPASATVGLMPGKYDFSVVATLTNGNDITLTAGTLTLHAGGRTT
jgi:hypothetical protein